MAVSTTFLRITNGLLLVVGVALAGAVRALRVSEQGASARVAAATAVVATLAPSPGSDSACAILLRGGLPLNELDTSP